MADYAIAESYPHLVEEENKYYYFFAEVVGRTARLMAEWQAVGFNHGVMNTDNMSIAGLTIDYGPYAFLDEYDFNTFATIQTSTDVTVLVPNPMWESGT